MRLLLLVLALSGLAFADSIDYASGGRGSDVTVIGSITAGHSWSVTSDLLSIDDSSTGVLSQGPELGTVDITSGTLFTCPSGLCFTGGSVLIKDETGGTIFTQTFSSGTITTSGGNTFLNANLPDGGTAEIESAKGVFSSNTIVTVQTTPEPASLALMGTGLLGLSFMRRWLH
jgi:hypothetical protein